MKAYLDVIGVAKEYVSRDGRSVTALENMTCSFTKGEFACILGATGCGKTTLLRLIAGLERPSRGEIQLNGERLTGIDRRTTMVFQQYSLFPWLRVAENVAFALAGQAIPPRERKRRALELLDRLGLQGFGRAFPHELSGGMQQRVAIARALAYDPAVLLLDEPFGALDERTRHHLQRELLEVWEHESKTVIFVTHNIDEALYLGDRVLVMSDRPGSVYADVRVDVRRPRDRRADDFVKLHVSVRAMLERILENN